MEIKDRSSLFTDDKIVYVDIPKEIQTEAPSTNKSNKVSGYKINAYKSKIFLYTSTEQLKCKGKITVLLTRAPKTPDLDIILKNKFKKKGRIKIWETAKNKTLKEKKNKNKPKKTQNK